MSLDFYTLDLHGSPLPCDDVETWAKWYEGNTHQRILKKTRVAYDGGFSWVSTIFLGIDFGRSGFDMETMIEEPKDPILYETMVFGGDLDGEGAKHHTREQAMSYHHKLVKHIEAGGGLQEQEKRT